MTENIEPQSSTIHVPDWVPAAVAIVGAVLILTVPIWTSALWWLFQAQQAWVETWTWPR